ncbi:MAG: putative lipid II flippase FtsW [Cyanobacteriota bacterium]
MSSKTLSIVKNNNSEKNDNKRLNFILGPYDKWLFYVIIILCVFGLVSIFSASGPDGVRIYDDPFYFLKRQVIFDILGIVLMLVISRIDYNYLRYISLPFGLIVCGLILATHFIGVEAYGGERWLKLAGFTFQPSEFGKLAAIILTADALAFSKTILDKKFIINMVIIAVMVVLILKQPSLSIAMITSASTIIVLFMGGFPLYILLPVIAVGFFGVVKVIQGTPYQLNRILGWLNPWSDPQDKGYNIIQSWYAFGNGGLLGVGFGNSKQKLFYLPFRHTDFIFAIISEELGLIGAIVLIGLFIAFVYRGLIISIMCETTFGKLLAVGIVSSIALQAFINMGVASGILPPTGITLPLISYGGSSTLAIFCMLGILLNLSRKRIQRISACS